MLGKRAGAWIGKSVPALAVIALGGWAFKKWRDKRRSHPSYPQEATPAPESSETRSPS